MTATAVVDVPSGTPARVDTPAPGDPRLARLSLNQRTTAEWNLREAIDGAVAAGLPAIGLWREPVAEAGLAAARRWVDDAGLRVSSLCRGGFFTASDPAERARAHEDNRRAVDEAAELGTKALVLVPGGLPPGDRDLTGARTRAAEAIAALVPHAVERGVTLGIEPMNPIYAADRGVISTLGAGARHRRGVRPARGRRRRRHVPPLVGAGCARPDRAGGGADRVATRCATGSPRSRPTPCSPAG